MGALLDRIQTPELDEELSSELTDEFEEEFEVDPPSAAFEAPEPEPQRGAVKKLGSRFKPTGDGRVSPALKRRITAELTLYLELIAGIAELKCELCASELDKKIGEIVKRGTSIMCRYPELAEKFVTSGAVADWIALSMALKDPVKTVVGHHITHTIVTEEEGHGDHSDLSQYEPYRPR